MKQADLLNEGGIFLVKGDVAFSNVMALQQKSFSQFNHHPEIVFDFSQVTSSDSSGLALIIEWVKMGKKLNKKIIIKNVPAELMAIAKASGLDKII